MEKITLPPDSTPSTWTWPLVADLACRMWKVIATKPVHRHLVLISAERVV